MNIGGARRIVLLGALAFASTLAGCEAVLGWLDDLAAQTDPEPPPSRVSTESPEEALPEKPSTSTARSETEVISFRTVLENREMTREQRIRAFQNLDPGALQKPVARANVSGAPATGRERQASREPADYEVAAARRRVPVVMYSTSWCGVCKRARKYFEEKRIAFEELDVDEDSSARAEYVLLNPRRSVPTIKIGDEVVVGFSAAAVERALDAAARSRMN
jgi:glutaredoxin-like YruB-family protein